MTDTTFYATEVPGYYIAEFGGITIQVDTVHRVVEMWVTADMCEDEYYDQAEAALSSLGIAALHEAREIEPMLYEARAYF